ncbi:MAG: hypothetical protein J6Z01_07055 [Bacteroidales bacterium]|nr:hypothetical protein [Bacteroidales bacterium]
MDDILSSPDYFIAHAGGSIDGQKYLNCKEGLLQSLKNGYKYIEVDLALTSDSAVVCLHDWQHFKTLASIDIDNEPMSLQEFQQQKILGKLTPLTLNDVISIQKEHPFVIVTDKISNPDILNRYFLDNRNNVMVEAFSLSDYLQLKEAGYTPMMSISHFNYKSIRWIFTQQRKTRTKIDWVCVGSESNIKSLRTLKRLLKCKIALYSSNSEPFFKEHLGKGIDLIYTDNWNLKTRSNNDSINKSTY